MAVSAALVLTVAMGAIDRASRSTVSSQSSTSVILLDAGHGGADGGAEASDGTMEKDINLSVTLSLGPLLHIMGYEVHYTRTDDRSVYTEGTTLREQKVSDMKYRLSQAETADLTVSIHQNQFSIAKYSGAQIFFSPNHADSKRLAESLRESVVSLLQPENTRQCKAADDTIFLLHNATRPAVIAECGFLSNPQELSLLKQPEYQRKMAFSLFDGIVQYLCSE